MIARHPVSSPANADAHIPPPRHVAIIMDGNRRWARAHGLPSIAGHHAGVAALREAVAAASDAGVEVLTVFAFSEQNKNRASSEVALLMDLVRSFAAGEAAALRERGVRVRAIGRIAELPAPTRAAIETLVTETKSGTGLLLNLALNYGARSELCDAIRALARDVRDGTVAVDGIDDDSLSHYLYTAGLPDPDLLIRTGGELRVSNFLLYQIAYTELWSTPVFWPEFDRALFTRALNDFTQRQRRFGT